MSILADLEVRLSARLDPLDRPTGRAQANDHDFDTGDQPLTAAAVLVPLIRRPEGWTIMFTQRTSTMPTHAGQISFPGGRIQPSDADATAAAVRETIEETGLPAHFITPIGGFGAYRTGTGYAISPIVAYIEPGFTLSPDPREVDEVFEAPFDFLMNPLNHQRHHREFAGKRHAYYAMTYDGRYIWGATGGMIRALYDRLYGEAKP